jgi:hypothetical protein
LETLKAVKKEKKTTNRRQGLEPLQGLEEDPQRHPTLSAVGDPESG